MWYLGALDLSESTRSRWCLLDLVVPFLAVFQQFPHQPFRPSYTATKKSRTAQGRNLPLLVLLLLPKSLPGVLQCFSLLCIMGPLALILLLTKLSASSQSFSLGWSHSHTSCWALLSSSWYKEPVTQVTGPEDLTLPSLLDSTNTISLLPWWQKFS